MRRISGKHAGLASFGVALVALAASLPTLVEMSIKENVRASVVVDTYKAWNKKHVNVHRPINVHAYNVTNLKAVLGAGAKPQLAKVDVALTHVEEGSDLKWLDGGDAYEFTRRSTYVARDAAEEARLDTEVVGLNPAYLATIAKYGSEGAMLRNLSHVAVSKVAEVLDAFITTERLAAVPAYLNAVAADLMATGFSLDGTAIWPSVESVARQWGGGSVLGGPLSSLDEKYTKFEAAVSEETALMLWDASHQYSLLTEAGVSAWTAALSGDGAAEIAAVVPESSAVLAWLAALVDESNSYYLAYVAPTLSDEPATSWRDLRGHQFASGAVTQKLYGVASVLSLQIDGVVVAPELPVYAAANGVTILMTAAEANDFLDTGSLSSSATADAYLNQYLPYDFLLKGFVVGYQRDGMTATTDPTGLDAASLALRADGTGYKNGGLFSRRTLREILYGYEDPLLELLGESYSGALNATTGRFGFRTGKRHLSDVGKYALWRGTTADVEAIGLRKAQAKPFFAKSRVTVWSDELLRPITFRSGAKTTVKDVEARNYHVEAFGLLSIGDARGPSMTRPALGGLDEAYRSQFEGLPTYNAPEHGTWAAVEPLTGRFVKQHTRLEHAWSLDSTQLDLELWQHVFARMASFPWPQLYTDESDEISGRDAKEFVAMVYGARDQAVIWAVIIGFLGLGLVFVGLHGISQDDDKAKTQVWPSPPREQRRPQHDAPKVEEDLFVEEVKEDPGEEYDDFPVDKEEPEPARKTMTMTIVHWLPTPYNYKRY